ncbi:MAG: transposase [Myxococcota bacterium]|nr:transposase [Myxococcota bacterium]MDW8362541.1 hypothetical protein [Myxococcales bacterium]
MDISTMGGSSESAWVELEKKSILSMEPDRAPLIAVRAACLEQLHAVPPHRLVLLDETGSHIAMTRSHGRTPRGRRLLERIPPNRGVLTTVLGAIARRSLTAPTTAHGGTSKDVFPASWVTLPFPPTALGMGSSSTTSAPCARSPHRNPAGGRSRHVHAYVSARP